MPLRSMVGLLGAAVVLAGCATVRSPAVTHVFPVRHYTLPSGLSVVIEQDDTSGLVGVVWLVDAGSADDPPGKGDLAHAVEHLAFRTTDAKGVSAWDRLIALGASGTNAGTGWESTTYYTFVPRRALDDVMAIELGRMAEPLRGVDDAQLVREQAVLSEEMDVRGGMSISVGMRRVTTALLPPEHPYCRATAHSHESSRGLSLDDARRFVERHYRPENMTLVISGAIPPRWDQQLFSMMPQSLHGVEGQRRPPVRRPLAPITVVNPRREVATLKTQVAQPEVWIAWLLPPALGPAAVPFDVLGNLVEDVLGGALHDDRLPGVTRSDTLVRTGALASSLHCRLLLRPSADPAAATEAVKKFVASLADLRGGYPEDYPKRVMREFALRTAIGAESLPTRAVMRAELAHHDPTAGIGRTVAAIQDVTVQELSALAARYLTPDSARAVVMAPGAPGAPSPSRAAGSLTSATGDVERDEGSAVEVNEPVAGSPDAILAIAQRPGAGAAAVSRLGNGLTLIALRRPGLPFASMILGFHAEPRFDEPPGARLAVMYARQHALRWTAADRGMLQQIRRDYDTYTESLSMFSHDVEEAFRFVDEQTSTLEVRWPGPKFERLVAHMAAQERTSDAGAVRRFHKDLWGSHPFGWQGTVNDLRRVAPNDIEAWLARVRRPANGVLVVVGDIDPVKVARDAEEALGGWTPDSSSPLAAILPPNTATAAGPPVPPLPPRMSFTAAPGQLTAEVRFGCLLPPVKTARDAVIHGFLTELMEQGLVRRLRTELGASYSPSVESTHLRGGSALLSGFVDINHDVLPAGIKVLNIWLDARAPSVIDPASVERMRWRLARRSNLRFGTSERMARALFDAWSSGWSPAQLDEYPRHLASVTARDLEQALAVCRANSVISVMDDAAPSTAAPPTAAPSTAAPPTAIPRAIPRTASTRTASTRTASTRTASTAAPQ